MAEIPELGNKETFKPTAVQQPFGTAGRELGQAGNILSSFGSDIAIKSSIARSEMAGIELGKNPQGDLLPALNTTDKAFTESYRNTAYSVLSLQADQLLDKSMLTVAQSPMISPEIIGSFESNMMQGIEKIVAQAPSIDKEKLGQSLASQYLIAKTKLDSQLITQQQKTIIDTFAAYTERNSSDIFNAASVGDMSSAQELESNYKAQAQEMYEAGYLTKVQYESAIKGARDTFLVGREFSNAQFAGKNGLPKYLDNYRNNKPGDMTQEEWITTGQELLKLVNFTDALSSKQEAFKISEGNLHVVDGTVNNQVISDMQNSLTPTDFNRWLVSYQKAKMMSAKDGMGTAGAIEGFTDPAMFSQIESKKDINSAYNVLWKTFANETGLDEWSAKTAVASNAGGVVPAYIAELNARAQTPNPEYLESAGNALMLLRQGRGANLNGLTDQSLAMISSYTRQRAGGVDPIVAAKNAEQMVLKIDETEKNKRETVLADVSKGIFKKTTDQLISGAAEITGMVSSTDPTGYALTIKQSFEDNFRIVGNELDAKNMTREQAEALFGDSYMNGKKETGQLETIEKVMGITKEQLPLVQVQVAQQIEPIIKRFNTAFESKNSDFRYDFKYPTATSLAEWEKARDELDAITANALRQPAQGESYSEYAAKTFSNPEVKARYEELQNLVKAPINIEPRQLELLTKELAELEATATYPEIEKTGRFNALSREEQDRVINKFENTANPAKVARMKEIIAQLDRVEDVTRPKIIRTFSDGTKEEFYLNVYRAPDRRVTASNSPIYYVKLENKSGRIENFMGVAPSVGGEVPYTPDMEDYNKKLGRYVVIANSGGKSPLADMQRNMKQHAEQAAKFIAGKRAKNQVDNPINSMVEAATEGEE